MAASRGKAKRGAAEGVACEVLAGAQNSRQIVLDVLEHEVYLGGDVG
jgi:hypothetical protein